jgi:PAS domain S-box-containing protein
MPSSTPNVNKSLNQMAESGNDTIESDCELNKELQGVFTNRNLVNALTVILNRQGRIVSFNKACEQTTGYLFDEVRNKYVWDLWLIPEEVERVKSICKNLKAGSCSEYNDESCWVMKDGTLRRIAWSSTALVSNEGAVEYIVISGIDITDRDLWAKQLNQQHQRTQLLSLITLKIRQSLQLEEILQTTVTEVRNLLQADRVVIYRLWSDGTGSGVTEAIAPGWPVILGQTFDAEVFPQEYHHLYATGRVRAIEDIGKADICPCLVEFLQQFGVRAKLVVPILLKEKLWGLLVVHQCASPRQWSSFEIELLRQLADQVSIALAQAQHQEHLEQLVAERTAKLSNTLEQLQQEISDRKQAEEALYRREQELKALVENSPDIIARFDRELRHVYVNPAVEQASGIPTQAFIGKTNRELGMPEPLVSGWHEAIQKVFNTTQKGLIEFDFPTLTGLKSYQAHIVPEYAQDGSVEFVLGVTRDITERKQAEQALRQWAFREQALNQVVQAIRNSLDLETIFSTAVEEVGKLLQVDRVVIVQYLPERKLWLNVADYRASPDLPLTLGLEIPDQGNEIAARLKRKEVILIDNASNCEDGINRKFAQTYPGAWLLVPLHFGSQVWGSLSFIAENRAYSWQESEVEVSLAVADQLAIAIQQAQLLHQSRTAAAKATDYTTQLENEIAERKQVEEELRQSEARFRELAQREALLNQLSNQIRRSLDINTILETTVHEIRNLLQIERCFFLWYRPNAVPPCWEVIQDAKVSSFPGLIGYRIPVTTFGPLTARVFNKEITRVDAARMLTDPTERRFFFSIGYTALLALPIHTTSGEIGVVSCGQYSGSRPWRDSEVELLQAVADQLAIAIDQAQLLEQSRIATLTAQEQAAKLEKALGELQQAQAQLVHSEKMSSLGQLVAGIAHEINNPVSFIYGNLTYINQYTKDLLNLIQLYKECAPQPVATIQLLEEELDLDFIREDLPKILSSMRMGADRIRNIVLSLRNFSRIDEAEMKWVDIHEGLDNTLLILTHRLKAKQPGYSDIQVIKDYANLPRVQCYPGQLNQVFMNIISNAIEAIDEFNKERSVKPIKNCPGTIWICTEILAACNQVVILIADNGLGMTPSVCNRLFDPFFTTKPVGQGTGLGMSISYQIVVEKHQGQVQCISAPGYGTAFLISIPIQQSLQKLVCEETLV